MSEYKANRTVIIVSDVNQPGSAFRLAVAPHLEDVTPSSLSNDPDENLVSAIAHKMTNYLVTFGWHAKATSVSGSDRPRLEVDLGNCIDVLKQRLQQSKREGWL